MLLVILWLIFAAFSATIATAKNRSGFNWFVAGILFGPIGLLASMGMPVRRRRQHY